ncbi:MAG: alginate O-acetyltransferase AlgX-related protein [bacterium]
MKQILTIPVRKSLTAIVMLLILVSGFFFSAAHIFGGQAYPLGNPETLFSHRMVTGEATSKWADGYNKNLPFRNLAVEFFGILKFELFREGSKGVLIGDQNWLYTSEDFETDMSGEDNYLRALTFVTTVAQKLEEDNISLVIAVLPSKSSLYPEHLGRYHYPSKAAARYQTILDDLTALQIKSVGLRPALQQAKQEGQVFLATDTHWTPLGAQYSAKAIADHLAAQVLLPAMTIIENDTDKVIREGDLVKFVPIGPLLEKYGYQGEPVYPYQTSAQSNDLFGETTIATVLVGTSYSANEIFSFVSYLRHFFGSDVLNVAEEGKGPFEPMRDYLVSDTYKNTPPRLIIWEIPERFFDRPYADAIFDLDRDNQPIEEAAG